MTGADFDIKSVRQDGTGGFWFVDKFGPFLLHADTTGRVLEAPIPLPEVKSPENPTLEAGERPNLPSSRGFEGMAISEDDTTLYPMLEGALDDDPDQRQRFIHEFDPAYGSYTGERWLYRTEDPENVIGDFTALDDDRFLVIERDTEQGKGARFKKVYLVNLGETDPEGFLVKREVLHLLAIRNPYRISEPARKGDLGIGDPFSFPFQTIESVLPLGEGCLLLLNDNNYPLSAGRNPAHPDDTEAIIVLPEALQGGPAAGMPGTGGPSIPVLAALSALGILGPAVLLRRVPWRAP